MSFGEERIWNSTTLALGTEGEEKNFEETSQAGFIIGKKKKEKKKKRKRWLREDVNGFSKRRVN